jgi:hypothetical protein
VVIRTLFIKFILDATEGILGQVNPHCQVQQRQHPTETQGTHSPDL